MTPIRASDANREFTATQLQRHVGEGRLTLDEFSDRAAAAYRSRTLGELGELLGDLPEAKPSKEIRAPDWRQAALTAGTVLVVVMVLAVAFLVIGVLGSNAMGSMMHDMMGYTSG